jgi:hypothetical protein
MAIAREDVTKPTGFKSMVARFLTIAKKIVNGIDYITELDTTAKTITGAINEVNANSGSTNIIGTASGAIATFSDGGDNIPLKSCEVAIVAQQASGTPSPSNPLPITGFSSVNATVCGKNLFDKSTSRYIYAKIPIGSTLYVLHNDASLNPLIIWVGFTDGTQTSFNATPNTKTTYVAEKNIRSIAIVENAYNALIRNNKNLTIALSDFTTLLPYTGTTHTVSLGQTIYGATAELVNGNGSKTWGYVDLGDLTWNYAGGTFRAIVSDAIAPISGGDTTAICEIYNRVGYSSSIADLSFYLCANQLSASKYLVIKDNSYNGDVNAFKTGVTGKKLVYTLETPTAFTFTGANIPTLSGENNIYSNCGDVEVEYFNNNADQTSELIDAKQEFCNYSYDEKVVGTWVDGSPLYEKTLLFNNVKLDKSDSTSELVHGIDNIGSTRFVAEVYFKFPNSGQDSWSPANNGLWNNGVYNFYWCIGETSIFILSASEVYFDANPNRSYLVKIRYTKA